MIKLKTQHILSPVNFSITATRALKHAASLAAKGNGILYLLHVQKSAEVGNDYFTDMDLDEALRIRRYLRERMFSVMTELRKEFKIRIIPIFASGQVPSKIVEISEKYNVGLIIMGTEGSDSVSSLFLSSNAYRVLVKTPIPLMSIRHPTKKADYSRILLPLDLSDHSRQKVNMALHFARLYQSRLHILGILGENEEPDRFKMKVIISQVKSLAREQNIPFTSEMIVTDDRALKTMEKAKEVNADLIFTMTDQVTGPSRFILGTYDHQLINESNVPVISIPPEIHEENIEPASIAGLW